MYAHAMEGHCSCLASQLHHCCYYLPSQKLGSEDKGPLGAGPTHAQYRGYPIYGGRASTYIRGMVEWRLGWVIPSSLHWYQSRRLRAYMRRSGKSTPCMLTPWKGRAHAMYAHAIITKVPMGYNRVAEPWTAWCKAYGVRLQGHEGHHNYHPMGYTQGCAITPWLRPPT